MSARRDVRRRPLHGAGDILQVITTLRSAAISMARLHEATKIAAACRRYAAQAAHALAAIGLTFRQCRCGDW
jgi:hypothetical protein